MPVVKGVSYSLIHAPDLLYRNGSTQMTERAKNPSSDYLIKLKTHLRSYEQALEYPPNQTYIGNISPIELAGIARPWYNQASPVASRYGKYGELMPAAEFYGLMKICDAFELVILENEFLTTCKKALAIAAIMNEQLLARLTGSKPLADIERLVAGHTAEGLYIKGKLVGCVRRAHESDENLSAHIMLENLAAKASGVLAVLHLLANASVRPEDIDYILECSEEACGDMNQRGGGNFAKSIGEIAGLTGATGADIRAFCAGPVHALLQAGSLIQAGVFKNVVVVGGGAAAKLGLNAKDHVAKGMPVLEDVLGCFAVLISAEDGQNPLLRLDVAGRHTIASGAAPQQVMKALVGDPLAKLNKKITEIDYYAVEMQNPELTEPAGAGNVPEANYKMIGALAAMAGEINRADLPAFVAKHGVPGFAPTQGHIPSGVPLLGFFRDQMLDGKLKTGMLIGKGSLFLGRMTNLFDGLSLILEANPRAGAKPSPAPQVLIPAANPQPPAKTVRIGLTLPGSEHGPDEIRSGAALACSWLSNVEVVVIDGASEAEAHYRMEQMLAAKELDGAVTLHYPFPVGVTTIGLAVTPARGRKMFIASSTGTSAADRVEALVRNAIYGIAAAKAYGIALPTVGLLNIDGARQAQRTLEALANAGYPLKFVASGRAGGGLMRGNDLLLGTPDVMVADTLTGNLLIKMLSAYTSGGNYETVGFGYGPGVGEGYDKLIAIISRASGAPVIANAIEYTACMARHDLLLQVRQEISRAKAAGLDQLLSSCAPVNPSSTQAPPKKAVTCEIAGLDVLELENAKQRLWLNGIYAEAGMGCTGPMLLVAAEDYQRALQLLNSNR